MKHIVDWQTSIFDSTSHAAACLVRVRNRRSTTDNRHAPRRRRGAAAVLAMMFLVIFGSLAAAMAIVSQGNLRVADTHMKVNRSLASAETGMRLIIYRLEEVADEVTTKDGEITDANAEPLWLDAAALLRFTFEGEYHNLAEPTLTGGVLRIGPVSLGDGEPPFEAKLRPHPITGEDYTDERYDAEAYEQLQEVHAASFHGKDYDELTQAEIDAARATWVPGPSLIRVTVWAEEGQSGQDIRRTIAMDFRLDKKIRFAILSRSRVMIGQNVIIDGAIGSRFIETGLNNGHPVQMTSDFRGLDLSSGGLEDKLDALIGSLITYDQDGDNRLHIYNPVEAAAASDIETLDTDGDGYVTDFDLFLDHFNTAGSGTDPRVTQLDLEAAGVSEINASQLLELIDRSGDPSRLGYGDGVIDANDRYAKISGQMFILASRDAWNSGAADPSGDGSLAYQDWLQGAIVSDDPEEAPLTFEADNETSKYTFEPEDFETETFKDLTDSDVWTQASAQIPATPDADDPSLDLDGVTEAVPFEAPYPYDYYDRPVFENMTFVDVRIPKGTNALFKNCRFVGVTYIETETENTDADYNYAGMQNADGSAKHPDRSVVIGGVEYASTKDVSNNLRFDDCTFEGAIVSDTPDEFTHTRNKVTFTGTTRFTDLTSATDSPNLTDDERRLYRRSTLLMPHYSVELGTFVAPHEQTEKLYMSGTIVAGLLDMRGQVQVDGSIITTFEPVSGEGPVLGDTAPQFNTTLGYFSAAQGDMEAEVPAAGLGVIHIRYDDTLALPDGITGPIEISPLWGTWRESGQ